jgi:hypothetical protein
VTETEKLNDKKDEEEEEAGGDTTTIPLYQAVESPLPEVQDTKILQNQSPRSVPFGVEKKNPPVPVDSVPRGRIIVASAPVRVDLAGGWSDTPPICYETEGAVSLIDYYIFILLYFGLYYYLPSLIIYKLGVLYYAHSMLFVTTRKGKESGAYHP